MEIYILIVAEASLYSPKIVEDVVAKASLAFMASLEGSSFVMGRMKHQGYLKVEEDLKMS